MMARWADGYISQLREGDTVRFRPKGGSMTGIINDGDLVVVEPPKGMPAVGDIVLCSVRGRQYVHLIKKAENGFLLIGNNRGGVNGWIGFEQVHGQVTIVNGKPL